MEPPVCSIGMGKNIPATNALRLYQLAGLLMTIRRFYVKGRFPEALPRHGEFTRPNKRLLCKFLANKNAHYSCETKSSDVSYA
jgi:hypothetical protein